ncbi:uncharacterized protein GIQ15_04111 [Arthroderma uncinatum]|uniref:uncharacterized protein n=1 Tax=Arthroderma uncinatum TaxID=74035 RepID=UPI00144AB144|nr:uncharacterized protein GIQ15_04111 [Arthroderma uncinatum]KAF3481352.1 hypothetical protein GIQ15_04111 [Arthroderma uncinatum]
MVAAEEGVTREQLSTKLLHPTPMIFDEERQVFGNGAGVNVLQRLDKLEQRIEQGLANLQKDVDDKHLLTMRLIRAPVYDQVNNDIIDPKLRKERNELAHGGAIITDLEIIRHLQKGGNISTSWYAGFNKLYGISHTIADGVPQCPKMAKLLDIHANVSRLHAYIDQPMSEPIIKKCKLIIKMWESACSQGRDPAAIFEVPTVATTYNCILNDFDNL